MFIFRLALVFCLTLPFLIGTTAKAEDTQEFLLEEQADTAARDAKKYYLQINALIRDSKGPDKADEKKTIKGVIIKVLNENNYLIASHFTDKKGKVSFKLSLDKKYTLLIGKKGYVQKIVEIDAFVPKELNLAFIFPVDVALFAEVPKLNTSALNKPIAKVKFNSMQREFVYDIIYTNKVNGELKKMYKEYYALKREEEMQSKKKN
jgi:hypothetical protein